MQRLEGISNCFVVPLIFLILISCGKPEAPKTPAKYRYKTVVEDSIYDQDKEYFKIEVNELIDRREGPFYPDSYELEAEVFIDSILYSPNKLKTIFFAIVKQPNKALEETDGPENSHYNAYCFLGIRDSKGKSWRIKWFDAMRFVHFDSYIEASKLIRFRYSRNLVEIKNQKGESRYKYNVNDIRFWESLVWEEKNFNELSDTSEN